jgi:DnaJ-class molecular chaperone
MPNTTFTLEFFSNIVQDPTTPCCYGEGQQFLTSITRTTDGDGNVSFDFTTQAPIPPGHQFMTATATDSDGNSSEFAKDVSISGIAQPSITVTAPNGGEDCQVNTDYTIQWISSDVSGNVKIELSRNGGSTYETLFANTPNDGS